MRFETGEGFAGMACIHEFLYRTACYAMADTCVGIANKASEQTLLEITGKGRARRIGDGINQVRASIMHAVVNVAHMKVDALVLPPPGKSGECIFHVGLFATLNAWIVEYMTESEKLADESSTYIGNRRLIYEARAHAYNTAACVAANCRNAALRALVEHKGDTGQHTLTPEDVAVAEATWRSRMGRP